MCTQYKKYVGQEFCHVKKEILPGFSATTPRPKKPCKNLAKWNIRNGRLRCQFHFEKWLTKKNLKLKI